MMPVFAQPFKESVGFPRLAEHLLERLLRRGVKADVGAALDAHLGETVGMHPAITS